MIFVVDRSKRPENEPIEKFIERVVQYSFDIALGEARDAHPKTSGFGTPEEPHVAAYKQGVADGLAAARDLIGEILAHPELS